MLLLTKHHTNASVMIDDTDMFYILKVSHQYNERQVLEKIDLWKNPLR